MTNNQKYALYAAGGLGVVALLWYAKYRLSSITPASIVSGAIGAADDIASGIVFGIGDSIGVPRIDTAKCTAARASGNVADLATYCAAPSLITGFIPTIWNGLANSPINTPNPNVAEDPYLFNPDIGIPSYFK